MRASVGLVVAALAAWILLAPVPGRADVPADGVVTIALADSAMRAVLGVYSSDLDPKGACTVSGLDRGVLVLRGGDYSSVGCYDGREFWGVLRRRDARVEALPSGAPAWLHAVRNPDGSLDITRWKGPAPAAVTTERWTRTGEFGRDARRAAPRVPPPPDDPTLPEFGAYVFVEELPEAIEKVPPAYPDLARRQGVEGAVMLQVLVGKDGLVKDHRVIKSIPMLDDAAVAAVRQWRFQPAKAKGAPVAVWVAVPVHFRLH